MSPHHITRIQWMNFFKQRRLCPLLLLLALCVAGNFTEIPLLTIGVNNVRKQHKNNTTELITNTTTTPTANATRLPVFSNDTFLSLQNNTFLLVHVGKTAGSSVVCQLGRRYPSCHQNKAAPSALAQHLASITHMQSNVQRVRKAAGSFDLFLVVLRNPLDRLLSWYAYEHPRSMRPFGRGRQCTFHLHKTKKRPKGCFANVQEFAGNVTPHATTRCSRLAWEVVTGQKFCHAHNAYNFQFYWNLMQALQTGENATGTTDNHNSTTRQKPIISIRTEHLANDWDTLEQMFGGTNMTGQKRFSHKRNKTRNKKPRQPTLQGIENLCMALCQEIQVYKKLLYASINLQPAHVHESLQEVIRVCPNETMALRSCPAYKT